MGDQPDDIAPLPPLQARVIQLRTEITMDKQTVLLLTSQVAKLETTVKTCMEELTAQGRDLAAKVKEVEARIKAAEEELFEINVSTLIAAAFLTDTAPGADVSNGFLVSRSLGRL